MKKKKKNDLNYILWVIGIIFGVIIVFFIDKLSLLEKVFSGGIVTIIILLLQLYLAIFLQVVIHELGHLVFGLMTGYKFLSYRVGNLMIIKKDNQLKVKKMSLTGTGGQCLMAPPIYSNGIPYLLYNLGGVIFNVFSAIIFLILYLNTDIFLIKSFSMIMTFVGLFYAIMNGIPLKLEINNDGYNVLLMLKNKETIRAFWLQMKINEQLLYGIRLKDMESAWFKVSNDVNNSLVNTIMVFACNRLIDEKKFSEAYEEIDKLLNSDMKMVNIHYFSLVLNAIYLELVLNNNDKYMKMYHDNEIQRFIASMKNSLDVLYVNYAYALLKENNYIKADEIKNKFDKVSKNYPYESDIKSGNELIEYAKMVKDKLI